MQVSRRIKQFGLAAGLAGGTFAMLAAGLPYGPLDFVQIALGQQYTLSSSGGGGTTTNPNNTTLTLTNGTGVTFTVLASEQIKLLLATVDPKLAPTDLTLTINSADGSFTLANNNFVISGKVLPNSKLLFKKVTTAPTPSLRQFGLREFGLRGFAAIPIPGGPAQFSPNGTLFDLAIQDANGNPETTFDAPLNLYFKYNAADLGQANGNPNILTAAYLIDETSPAIENPNHYPVGTWVFFAPSVTNLDTTSGVITVNTQAVGSTMSVITNPVGYVQTLTPNTPELSSFDPNASQTFGTKPQFSYLQVTEPQIGGRLLVLDPDTGNYSYVNATDVAPSGPPPARSSSAVVRGAQQGVAANKGVAASSNVVSSSSSSSSGSSSGVARGLLLDSGVAHGLLSGS